MSCNKYTGEGTLTTTLFLLYKETMIENTPKLKHPMWQHPYLLILSLWPNILWENFLNSKPCCLCLPSAVQTAVMWVQEQHICRLYHFDMRRAWIFHVWRCLNLFWRQVDRKKGEPSLYPLTASPFFVFVSKTVSTSRLDLKITFECTIFVYLRGRKKRKLIISLSYSDAQKFTQVKRRRWIIKSKGSGCLCADESGHQK